MRNNADSILRDCDGFHELVIERLRTHPQNFLEHYSSLLEREKTGEHYQTSGVILLLQFSTERKQWEFLLTKRSRYVAQPGDLCCPGGHVSLRDRIHGLFISHGLTLIQIDNLASGKNGGMAERKTVAHFLATALREAREETGLHPRHVTYLGSLPPYGLLSFRRVIYPSVGMITGVWKKKLNWEVEKLISISVRDMLLPDNYHWITFEVPEEIKEASQRSEWNFPAYVFDDGTDREILWGATFNIIQSFLSIVLNFTLPEIPEERLVYKEIPESYFTGRFNKILKAGFRRERKGEKKH